MSVRSRLGAGIAAAILFAAAMPAALASGPPAQSGPVERFTEHASFFYWSNGYLAIVGETVEKMCLEDVPAISALGITTGNDGGQFRLQGRVPAMVFADERFQASDPNIGFVWLDEVCGEGVPVEPVATGDNVRLRVAEQISPDGTVHSENSLVGRVTTTEGKSAQLTTHASVVFDGSGLIKLDPFFVRYTG